MKPIIRVFRIGDLLWWRCSTPGGMYIVGDSPRNAYIGWESMNNAYKR